MNQSLMRYRGRLAVLGGLGLLAAAIVAGCGRETKSPTASKDSAMDAKMTARCETDLSPGRATSPWRPITGSMCRSLFN